MKVFVINKKSFFYTISTIVIVVVLAITGIVAFVSPIQVVSASNSLGAIYKGDESTNNVSIMINVYWGNEYIEPILDILDQNNVKATFFVGGSWVARNNDVLQAIFNRGHEIGNHGYNHLDHTTLGDAIQKKEIESNHSLVKELIGVDMTVFAPPSGAYNKKTVEIATSLGYSTIMWSKDTIDWRDKDSTLIYSRAVKDISNGDLILMHPTEKTVEALPDIIKTIKNNGYNLVTVSQNINISI